MKVARRTTKTIMHGAASRRCWRWPLAFGLALALIASLFHDFPALAERPAPTQCPLRPRSSSTSTPVSATGFAGSRRRLPLPLPHGRSSHRRLRSSPRSIFNNSLYPPRDSTVPPLLRRPASLPTSARLTSALEAHCTAPAASSAARRRAPFFLRWSERSDAAWRRAGRGTAYMIRIWLVIAGVACGVLLASLAPGLIGSMRAQLAALPGMAWLEAEAVEPAAEARTAGHAHHDEDGTLKLSDEQVAAAGIESGGRRGHPQPAPLCAWHRCTERRPYRPCCRSPAGDRCRVAQAAWRSCTAGEVVAVIESREVADAKSEYLAARLVFDFSKPCSIARRSLFEGKVLSENDYLRARTTVEDARVKIETARQKLFALGLTAEQIDGTAATAGRNPASARVARAYRGRVAERRVELGLACRPRGPGERAVRHRRPGRSVGRTRGPAHRPDGHPRGPGDQHPCRSAASGMSPRQPSCSSVRCSTGHTLRPGGRASLDNPNTQMAAGLLCHGGNSGSPGNRPRSSCRKAALQTIKGERVVFVRNATVSRRARSRSAAKTTAARRDRLGPLGGRAHRRRPTPSSSRPSSAKPKPSTRTEGSHDQPHSRTFRFGTAGSWSWPALGACALGAWALARLPIDAVPDITNNQVQINTVAPALSPVEIEKQVTFPIETALAGIPGLDYTRSLSRNGFSQVTAVFAENDRHLLRAPAGRRAPARGRATACRRAPSRGWGRSPPASARSTCGRSSTRPSGEQARVATASPGWQSDGAYLTPEGQRLRSEVERAAYLRTVQDWIIRPQLKSVPGVAGVDAIGGYVKQYHVAAGPDRSWSRSGLSFADVVEALEANNVSRGAGYIEQQRRGLRRARRRPHRERRGDRARSSSRTRGGVPDPRQRRRRGARSARELRTGSASENGEEVVRRHRADADRRQQPHRRRRGRREDGARSAARCRPDIAVKTVLNRTAARRRDDRDGREEPRRGRAAGDRRAVPAARATSARR